MQRQQQMDKEVGFTLPALDITSKNYSLQADMLNGWQPKLKVIGPVPLNYDCSITDEVVEILTNFGKRQKERIVFLGHRPSSSFKLHQEIKRQYLYKYEAIINTNFPHLAAYFRKFYSNFKTKSTRLFRGMNPTLRPNQEPIFDSNFEGGNLDVVIKVGNFEYDLFMRVDSNTRGHVQWYNFTLKNNGMKKVKLNIVNFRKHRTLYNSGLRPYLLSSVRPLLGWKQSGLNVKYEIKQLRYLFLEDRFQNQSRSFNCLSFEYQFQSGDELIQIAYCPPFSYSDNNRMIAQLKKSCLNQTVQGQQSESIFKEQILCESLGGLQIPLITITDPTVAQNNKKCMFVTARIHPGQTCGSHMINGFLQFICSQDEQACYLRQCFVFKIVPMVNPDGVVAGNFRTSLCGRDLNRMFRTSEDMLIPEVKGIKNLVSKLRQEFKGKFPLFLDFHGHSVRKNVFVYGPQYQIWQTNYYKTRILPKIIAARTEIFRYYSCFFRISDWKRTTARAVLLKQIPHCYTVEASIGFYYSVQERKDIQFGIKGWEFMGKTVVQSIGQYQGLLNDQDNQKERKKMIKKKQGKQIGMTQNIQVKQRKQGIEVNTAENKLQRIGQIQKQLFNHLSSDSESGQRARKLIQQIQQQGLREQNHSERGSDSQGPEDDMQEKELTSFHQQIILSLKEFKDKYLNGAKSKDQTHSNSRKILRSSAQIPRRGIEMIASLRKKAQVLAGNKSDMGFCGQTKVRNVSMVGENQQFWPKSRTQSIRQTQLRSPEESFQMYVNRINFVVKGTRDDSKQCKIEYSSPRKKRLYGRIGQN